MKILSLLALSAALSLAVGAAAQAPPGAPPAAPPAKRQAACFWQRDVQNFAATDDQTLYVRVGVSDIYQLKLFSPCIDLTWDHHLALITRGGSDICEGSAIDAEVVAPEAGLGHQRCEVTSVRKLSPDEVVALPKDGRP